MEPPAQFKMTRIGKSNGDSAAASASESTPPSSAANNLTAEEEKQRKIDALKLRELQYEELINGDVIDLKLARQFATQGIPEKPGLRAMYWRLLLDYLPPQKKGREEFLRTQRETYRGFTQDLILDASKLSKSEHIGLQKKDVTHDDHPLNDSACSQWNIFFKDSEVLAEIDKDVKRTFPHLHFFNANASQGSTEHYEALRRILFIYAKLNPGIRYVQGMNEILGPIYYIFASDPHLEWRTHAEADAFFCFTSLMSDVMNHFVKTLDRSDLGINGAMKRLNALLREADYELWNDMEAKKIDMEFYSFRWLTLLLSQEFELPDVMRLWDALFAARDRYSFLLYFCCTMILNLKQQILAGDFAESLALLQNYPPTDISQLIMKSLELSKTVKMPVVAPLPGAVPSPLTTSGPLGLSQFNGTPVVTPSPRRPANSPLRTNDREKEKQFYWLKGL